MDLENNVIIDPDMEEKRLTKRLTRVDEIKLDLANKVGAAFPSVFVWINPQQEKIESPCLFVSFYEVQGQKRLSNIVRYQIGLIITYVPKDSFSNTELENAVFLLLQTMMDPMEYEVKGLDSEVADGVAIVTGRIYLQEFTTGDVEKMKKLKQGVGI